MLVFVCDMVSLLVLWNVHKLAVANKANAAPMTRRGGDRVLGIRLLGVAALNIETR